MTPPWVIAGVPRTSETRDVEGRLLVCHIQTPGVRLQAARHDSVSFPRTSMRKIAVILATAAFVQLSPAEARTSDVRLLLLTPFVDYAFFEPVKKGMQDAARAMGVEATFDGTKDGNVKALAEKVKGAIDAGYDGIAVNMIDPVAFDKVAAEAARKGVPAIAFNVDDSHTPNARLAAVGQNMLEAGRKFGRQIFPSIAQSSHILLTMHDPDITALEDRAKGIQEELRSRNVRWTELITSTDREEAVKRIRAALQADPTIKTILSTGSADTEAAGLAIERYFSKRDYITAGFDLSPDILRMIEAGIIRFSIDQQPYSQGYLSVVNLTLQKRYGLAPSNIDTGAGIITAAEAPRVLKLSEQHFR
jgi:simple sugar transport system substrate-binding protein